MKEKRLPKMAGKGKDIRQVATLPFRRSPSGTLEVLLLTSPQTARFVVPKGWPMKGMADWEAAALEAKQEAGVIGKVSKKPVGQYRYWKRLESIFVRATVTVFPLMVTKQKDAWREKAARQQKWLNSEEAISLIDEPDLAARIAAFAPDEWSTLG